MDGVYRYHIELAFKDGRVKYDPIMMTKSIGTYEWNIDFNGRGFFFKKNGKPAGFYKAAKEEAESVINGVYASYIAYILNDKPESEEDW